MPFSRVLVGQILFSALLMSACAGHGSDAKGRMTPEYDKTTGKLTLLKYDSDGDGKIDMWSYMDGARVVRIEIDRNEDGLIERWEYYDANQRLEKVGTSRAQNGKEDAWSYPGADGSIERIDVSTRQDGKITRVELLLRRRALRRRAAKIENRFHLGLAGTNSPVPFGSISRRAEPSAP